MLTAFRSYTGRGTEARTLGVGLSAARLGASGTMEGGAIGGSGATSVGAPGGGAGAGGAA